MMMKREIMRDREALSRIVADADSYLASLHEVLIEGELDESQFKAACSDASKMVIVKAAINSLEVMK